MNNWVIIQKVVRARCKWRKYPVQYNKHETNIQIILIIDFGKKFEYQKINVASADPGIRPLTCVSTLVSLRVSGMELRHGKNTGILWELAHT